MMRTVLAVALAALADPGSAATLPPEEVGRKVAEEWGVEVLRVRQVTVDSRKALAVTVMSPGGAFNGAMGVTTLLVDAESGSLLPQFRHRTSGYTLPADQPGPQPDIPGTVIRERATR
jgi:hypothetical protein